MLKNLFFRNDIVHVSATVEDPAIADLFNAIISDKFIECHSNYDIQSKVTTFMIAMRRGNYSRMLRELKLNGLRLEKGKLV